jgi:phage terminase small subunit
MKNSEKGPKSNFHLSAPAAKMRQRFIETWEIQDPAGLTILDEMCACYDRLQEAKRLFAEHGSTVTDRFGQIKVSPWFLQVRDETTTLLRLQKSLSLEVEGENRPGRPEGYEVEP